MKRLDIRAQEHGEAQEKTVDAKNDQELNVEAQYKKSNNEWKNDVEDSERKFKAQHFTEMFAQQVAVLRYIAVIEISESKIEQYVKQEGKIKNYEVFTVVNVTDLSLHFWLYDNRPERLN